MPQRRIKMPVRDKQVAKKEAPEAPPQQKQPEAGRYQLQVDRQTKSSFNSLEVFAALRHRRGRRGECSHSLALASAICVRTVRNGRNVVLQGFRGGR